MIHFFPIGMGSSSELEYQLILPHDLHDMDDEHYVR
jgi:hypothetical protein